MILVSVCAFTLTLILLGETLIRRSDFFSPARLYLFAHSLALGVAFLGLHEAMTPFRPVTSLVYFGSGACYILGVWMVGLLSRGASARIAARPIAAYNWKMHLRIAWILFVVFLGGMLIAAWGIGTFPMFAEDKAQAIRDFFSVTWFSSVALSYGGITMGLFYMAIFRTGKRRRYFDSALLMTLVTGSIYVLALSRSGLMFFALFAVIFFHQAVRRISLPRMGLVFLVMFSAFMVTMYLKLSNFQKEHNLNLDPGKLAVTMLKFPYIYVANNFWNLDHALNPENTRERHGPTFGFTMVGPVFDMLIVPGGNLGVGIRDGAGWDDQFHASSIKVKGLNTMGYQWGLYKDFGIIGCMLLPFLFGVCFKILYLRLHAVPTQMKAALYAYLAFFVGMSWFLAFWESMIYLYGLLLVVGASYLCQRTAPQSSPPAGIGGAS